MIFSNIVVETIKEDLEYVNNSPVLRKNSINSIDTHFIESESDSDNNSHDRDSDFLDTYLLKNQESESIVQDKNNQSRFLPRFLRAKK